MNKEELRKQITEILYRALDAYDAAQVDHLITQYASEERKEARKCYSCGKPLPWECPRCIRLWET